MKEVCKRTFRAFAVTDVVAVKRRVVCQVILV
jgi:hypothetical protein